MRATEGKRSWKDYLKGKSRVKKNQIWVKRMERENKYEGDGEWALDFVLEGEMD